MNQKCQSSEEEIGNPMDENEFRLIGCEGFITTPSSAAPSKNFPTEIRTIILDATNSEEIKSDGTKQGKPTSDDELVEKEHILRLDQENEIEARRFRKPLTTKTELINNL
ncbi:hypothetical protein DAPPUDRAFT_238716 [Daphnia pulex]|uniref:Uncharacterized protein n=1 Tax=Daphnia pulex TaxID=6669 RepID=E9G778_DAPPU|nr:hypothetical protein DAPPUDRAFT_238716 [Daphnia pulex]|eukprot:EFX84418.1 hypothetical protein DAPPUDRAFT_238716 [Daphnia pulex]